MRRCSTRFDRELPRPNLQVGSRAFLEPVLPPPPHITSDLPLVFSPLSSECRQRHHVRGPTEQSRLWLVWRLERTLVSPHWPRPLVLSESESGAEIWRARDHDRHFAGQVLSHAQGDRKLNRVRKVSSVFRHDASDMSRHLCRPISRTILSVFCWARIVIGGSDERTYILKAQSLEDRNKWLRKYVQCPCITFCFDCGTPYRAQVFKLCICNSIIFPAKPV